jgi:ABC-2 type transport system ATP-binding protein
MMKEGQILYHGTPEKIKGNFGKIQAVFPDGMPEIISQMPGLRTYSNIGSVYTMILEQYEEQTKDVLLRSGATLVEEIPMSLEEVFVHGNQQGR